MEGPEDAEPSREIELDGSDEFGGFRGRSIPGLDMVSARGEVAVVAIGREQRLIKWAPSSFKND